MLDHVTLRTGDLEGTRAFLEALLDLTPGYRPPFGFPGYWLYQGGEPLVHLIPGDGSPAPQRGEIIDHVAFRLTGYDEHCQKLDRLGIAYARMDLTDLSERRLFVRTPTKILIELVFRENRAPTPASGTGHA